MCVCVLLNRLIGVTILAFFYTLPSLFNFSLFQVKSWLDSSVTTSSTSFAVSLSTFFFHVHAFFLFLPMPYHTRHHSLLYTSITRFIVSSSREFCMHSFTEGVSFLRGGVVHSEGEQTFYSYLFSSFLYSFFSGWLVVENHVPFFLSLATAYE